MTMTWFPASGASLALTRPNYYVTGFTGFGGAPTSNRTLSAPYQDGATLVDTRLDSRLMVLTVIATADSVQGMWDRRRAMIAAFDPKLGIGTMRVATPTGRTYEIRAISDGSPVFARTNQPYAVTAQIALLAPHPYWYDSTVVTDTLGSAPDEMEVDNEGDIASWLEVVFIGPLTIPRVTLVGASPAVFVQVDYTLVTSETITLRAGPGPATATRELSSEQSDALQFISGDSDLPGLRIPKGVSDVGFSADLGAGDMTVNFFHWFVGI